MVDLRRTNAAVVVTLLAVAACSAPVGRPVRSDGPWEKVLRAAEPAVVARQLPAAEDRFEPRPDTTLVIVDDGERASAPPFSDLQRSTLREFVANGGRLLLLGHAASLVAAIGVEPEWPEATTFRWGFDRRAAIGRARLGLHVVSGNAPQLFEALAPAAGHEDTFFLTGGEPCSVPSCSWSVGAPQQGEVLARLATEVDGEMTEAGGAVVVRWAAGRGEVIACGLLPAIAHDDADVRGNATAFAANCVKWLQRRQRGPVVVLQKPRPPAPALAAMPEPFTVRRTPNLPLVSHWGWQTPLRAADEAEPLPVRELLDGVVLPSFGAGADLLELELTDATRGAPFAWSERDPLKRPPSWREDAEAAAGAAARVVAEITAEAHARGMLVAGAIDPMPVGDGKAERLVALRFLARELADARRLGAHAVDGFTVREWWSDADGYGASMLQDFHPGAFLASSGERGGVAAGGVRALDADDGAPRGSDLAGISAVWRDGFAAAQFPLGVLEARAVRSRDGGGGSRGDWIVAQANDFVRDRRGLGAAMWWRRHDAASFDRSTVAYVHGVSMEPLVAAVATSLASVGSGGRRAAAQALLDPAPAGYGAESDVACAVHVLQNNRISLAGSGGALRWDRAGLARFRANEATTLAAPFLRTRLFGARPDGDLADDTPVDLLAGGRRGAGDYGTAVHVGDDARVPEVLAAAEAPAWPAAFTVDWRGEVGYHELELDVRGVRDAGVVEVSLDAVPLRCVPFRTGAKDEPVVIPLHKAGPGVRTLELRVVDSGAVAIDRLRIVRRGEVGAEARVVAPAGSRAVLEERSHSRVHDERVELATIADFPGFVTTVRTERAARGLMVERTFGFTGPLRALDPPPDPRAPFVLRTGGDLDPDVLVVPLQMQRHDRLEVGADGLVLHGAPERGSTTRIGFVFCERSRSRELLRVAPVILASIARPDTFDLGTTGEATITSDLPVSWPRVIHLATAPRTPIFVRENGTWTLRGTQPAPDGGAWLRIRHDPREPVQIVEGPSVFARTRPGPGAFGVVALRDPEPRSATAIVAQPSVLATPSVVMAQDFTEVRVDGEPWSWFDGRTVFLPDRVGTCRIECRTTAGGVAPHVRSTRAPLQRCSYDPVRRVLTLVVPPTDDRPLELPWTAVLHGPRPKHVANGEIVDDASLRLASADAAAAARAGGVLIRFRSGITEVSYGE